MHKKFNVTGCCNKQFHYMVDITGRLEEIKVLIDSGEYFAINRARQYGKTTTLMALRDFIQNDYIPVFLDFQFLTQAAFKDEYAFSRAFAKRFVLVAQKLPDAADKLERLKDCCKDDNCDMAVLFEQLSEFCAEVKKPVVLIIDEVDSASNNQVFLDFLSLLRGYYLHRQEYPTFHSVILGGVYDVRKLKQKLRPDEEHKNNSPWNIAAKFSVDMSFSTQDIEKMLVRYEEDYHTGMDVKGMAGLLYDYTSGYPFLVSNLCKIIDEDISSGKMFGSRSAAWTEEGFKEAVKKLLIEKNALFESLINKLTDYPDLKKMIHAILFSGDKVSYNPDNDVIDDASMLGFVKNVDGAMVIANRIFETRLYNLFLSEEEINSRLFTEGSVDKNQFVEHGILNMDLLMERFMVHWQELYHSADEKFIEENGRKFFLLYLKPIINGTGNYYVEARTRDNRRTDVIVDYRGKQYVIEIKIWRGNEYNKRGEEQLADYLDAYRQKRGYLLSFNFNKNKQTGIKEIVCGDKSIFEVIV